MAQIPLNPFGNYLQQHSWVATLVFGDIGLVMVLIGFICTAVIILINPIKYYCVLNYK